ncbi:MAG: carboxypeptidase-like regulatory domain-containing protein [Lacinutrix sp.]
MAQSTVTGKVFDAEMNGPLPGANVLEKGTSNGTTTDFEGNFSLKTLSDSGEIVITFVGYDSMTSSFKGNTNLGTKQLTSDSSLEEVVIIGSGVIDLAGSRATPVAVSTIRGKDIQLKAAGNVEFGEAMKNTPSVYVSNQAGGFGDS